MGWGGKGGKGNNTLTEAERTWQIPRDMEADRMPRPRDSLYPSADLAAGRSCYVGTILKIMTVDGLGR